MIWTSRAVYSRLPPFSFPSESAESRERRRLQRSCLLRYCSAGRGKPENDFRGESAACAKSCTRTRELSAEKRRRLLRTLALGGIAALRLRSRRRSAPYHAPHFQRRLSCCGVSNEHALWFLSRIELDSHRLGQVARRAVSLRPGPANQEPAVPFHNKA